MSKVASCQLLLNNLQMLQKIELDLSFDTKRHRNIITPCCKRNNKDGKFATYKHLPLIYGYCHSCGKATLPPMRYKNDSGHEFIWNDKTRKMEPTVTHLYDNIALQACDNYGEKRHTTYDKTNKKKEFVDFKTVRAFCDNGLENNLLRYFREKYGNTKTDLVKEMYYIGTSKDLGTVFWNINRDTKAQKVKVSYYKPNGKRTKYFKVPYKNDDGYYSCLFGEHLLDKLENRHKAVILVESEKTAAACAMWYLDYVWLAYGGISGLTIAKIETLIGRKVILIPDISEKAVEIMNKNLLEFKALDIDAKILDLRSGKSDDELIANGWYNSDLEDILRADESL